MVTCICMAEYFLCLPEFSTTVLIGYTPILNKKLNKIHHVQIPDNYRKKHLISSLIDMQKLFAIDIMQYLFGNKHLRIGGNFINEHRVRKRWEHFSNAGWKLGSTANSMSCKLSFWIKGRKKKFPDKAKLRELVSSRTILKNFSKERKIEKELRF